MDRDKENLKREQINKILNNASTQNKENIDEISSILNKFGIEDNVISRQFLKLKLAGAFNYYENALGRNIPIGDIEKYYMENMPSNSNIWDAPLKTKMGNKEKTLELAKEFFSTLPNEYAQKAIDIIDNKNASFSLEIKEVNTKVDENGNVIHSGVSNFRDVFCERFGDLKDIYILVHEITHTLDLEKNQDNSTRNIYGEIAPQCMERYLDTFLLNLDDEKINKYGFNYETLKNDIETKKITTFVDRFHKIVSLNRETGNPVLDIRYILAQHYSSVCEQLPPEKQLEEIIKLIDSVKKNDIIASSQAFGVVLPKIEIMQDKNTTKTFNKITNTEQFEDTVKHMISSINKMYRNQTKEETLSL